MYLFEKRHCKTHNKTLNDTVSGSYSLLRLYSISLFSIENEMIGFLFQVLTDRRISQLSGKPLQATEFIAPLARLDPVYKEEEEAFKVTS